MTLAKAQKILSRILEDDDIYLTEIELSAINVALIILIAFNNALKEVSK